MKSVEALKLKPGDRVYMEPNLPLGAQNATVRAVMTDAGAVPPIVFGLDVPAGWVCVQPDSSEFTYWHHPSELGPEKPERNMADHQ